MKKALLLLLALVATRVSARDLGFRFENGKCQGYNPSFLGQCSDLRSVTLSGFALDQVDLSGSVFDRSDLQSTTFKGANLTGASFAGADLSGVDFDGAVLHQTSFDGAILLNTHFAGADMAAVNFSHSDLSGSMLNDLSFPGCIFAGAKLAGASVDHADFTGADLRATDFTGLDLRGSIFKQAQIDGAIFQEANLKNTNFAGALGGHAVFGHALLNGAHFEQAQLSGASFRASILLGSSFTGADLAQADFRRADMRQAAFDQTVLTGAKFSRATVLPFSADEAAQRGMVLSKSGLLILWDVRGEDLTALTTYLEAHGVDTNLSSLNATAYDGREDLSEYTAVLHLLGASTVNSHNVPANGQDALRNFVYSGGTYIATQMIGRMADSDYLLKRMSDLVLLGYDEEVTGSFTWNSVAGKENHPLLKGIDSSIAVRGLLVTGNAHPLTGNTILMRDQYGNPMVAVRQFGAGRAVNFGFAGSVENRDTSHHTLMQEPLQRLILNAINWTTP